MEWRCEWCGKPHAEDDPPCEACGHHKFEKAVVQVAGDISDDAGAPVWVCTECGREHQKNSPPCSRCGNADLERRQPDYSDLPELGGTSYLDVLEPKYAVGYAIAGVLGTILLLAVLGVISLPTLGGVPGQGGQVGDVSLADVENETVARLQRDRSTPLARNESLDAAAEHYNAQLARQVFGGAGDAPSVGAVREDVAFECSEAGFFAPSIPALDRSATDYDAAELAAAAVSEGPDADRLADTSLSRIGIDVRAIVRDDETDYLVVTVVVC